MFKTAEDIRQLNERITDAGQFTDILKEETGHVIVGQHHMLDRLLIGLLSNGHVLLVGVPGLAKTLAIKSLASGRHHRFIHPCFCCIFLEKPFPSFPFYISPAGIKRPDFCAGLSAKKK